MNILTLIGTLTSKPYAEQKTAGAYCRFPIAVDRNYTAKDGNKITDYFTITTWGTQAENCEKYLDKGRKVAVVGALRSRQYEDTNGRQRSVIEIVADKIEFLDAPKRESLEEIDGADLPF